MAVSEDKLSNNGEKQTKESFKSRDKKEKLMTKIIVRRLPPSLDLESFLNHVSPLPDHDYIYVVKGDMSLGENAFARAYINFVNFSDIFLFKEKFDNYVFVDHKGHEYPAVVEFASFQKIPKRRKPRHDPKKGTIELDLYYLEFLESLKEVPAASEEKPEFSYQISDKVEVQSTPLLDFVKQKRVDRQRIREERREERRKREFERKKIRDDEYRKKIENKSSTKSFRVASNPRKNEVVESIKEEPNEAGDAKVDAIEIKENITIDKKDQSLPLHKNSENKYDDNKTFYKGKPRFEKKNDFKNNKRDDYKEKDYRNRRFDDYKKETNNAPRRTKKYSEKREERKNEARKAEQKQFEETLENASNKVDSKTETTSNIKDNDYGYKVKFSGKTEVSKKMHCKVEDNYRDEEKLKDNDPRSHRRIRNKDRPTMAIYQPGMLSRKRTSDDIGKD